MEYEAEFVQDQNSFFKQDLIRECTEDYYLINDDQLKTDDKILGNYYLGADFGKKVDYSVITSSNKNQTKTTDSHCSNNSN